MTNVDRIDVVCVCRRQNRFGGIALDDMLGEMLNAFLAKPPGCLSHQLIAEHSVLAPAKDLISRIDTFDAGEFPKLLWSLLSRHNMHDDKLGMGLLGIFGGLVKCPPCLGGAINRNENTFRIVHRESLFFMGSMLGQFDPNHLSPATIDPDQRVSRQQPAMALDRSGDERSEV